jgi:hypothetical protein
MRYLGRNLLIGALVSLLVEAPVFAVPSTPLGLMTEAKSALVDRATAVAGSTIYPGDRIQTGSDGLARLRIGSGQVYLLASSTATLSGTANGIVTDLTQGTAGFGSAEGQLIELRAPQATLRPKGPRPTHASLTIISPTQLVVSSYRGEVELRVGDESYTIGEHLAYRVDISEEQQPGPQGVGKKPVRRTRAALVLLTSAAVAGIAAYGIRVALESPNHP